MGSEFRVNTYQRNWQDNSDIVTFADGGFLVVWDSYFNNYDDSGLTATYLAGQRFDAAGRRVEDEMVLDVVADSSSERPSATVLRDGGFAVAYMFDNYDDILTLRTKIWVSIFNPDGSLQRLLRVDQPDSAVNNAVKPEIFATEDGGFRVMWVETRSTAGFDRVVTRAFDSDGDARGPTRVANINIDDFDQSNPESATLRNGATITVWRSEASFETGTDLDANELRGTLTDASGAVVRADFSLGRLEGTITAVGNRGGLDYAVTAMSGGGFAVSHVRDFADVGGPTGNFDDTIVLRFFDARGNLIRRDTYVHTTDEIVFDTSVTQLASGEIVVVWEQYGEDEVGTDVLGRVMTADGRGVSPVFEIGVDADSLDNQESPVVRALAGGGFVVSYTSESVDSDDDGIAARIFGRGTGGDDVLDVDRTGTIAGLGGDDRLAGNGGRNALYGNAGADTLSGGGGDDRLTGGTGKDRLAGGQGADSFVFGNRPGQGMADSIMFFDRADVIVMDNASFAGIGPEGRLDARHFKLAGQSVDGSDRVIYAPSTGTLFFDANGSGAGGRVAVAVLENRPVLTAADILIF